MTTAAITEAAKISFTTLPRGKVYPRRQALLLLFVLFYLGSSVAVTASRTSIVAAELQHASDRGNEALIQECCQQLHGGCPRYREAKKAGMDVPLHVPSTSISAPRITINEFHVAPVYLVSSLVLRIPSSRAPPPTA
jgi:hypothetical protein